LIRELKQEMPSDIDEYLRVRKISGLNGNGDTPAGTDESHQKDGGDAISPQQ
jgi:hypothetical protein